MKHPVLKKANIE